MTGWVGPTVVYVLLVGVFGIATKYGLRQVSWQGLFALTTVAYALVLALFLAVYLGARFPFRVAGAKGNPALDWPMVALASLIPPLTIVLFFLAVSRGPVTRIVPITSVYPLVTVAIGALVLSEKVTWQTGAGVLLVVGGVVLLGL